MIQDVDANVEDAYAYVGYADIVAKVLDAYVNVGYPEVSVVVET